jgi:BirA family biotin operon repressor/biotin-[acetyl-CoA-carboxylase] ligase
MSKQKAVSPLDAQAIRTYLNAFDAQSTLSSLTVLDQIDSTTHYLQQHYPDSHMAAVISDSQYAGMGSYGRTWSSPPGVGIWLSFSWRGNAATCRLTSLRIGYAIWEAITPYCAHQPQLKWPNDVVYQDQKLAGIRIDRPTPDTLVIGIGLNVFPYVHPHAPSARALSSISNQPLCRNRLMAAILWRCQWHLTHIDSFDILSAWQAHDALTHTYLHFTSADQTYEGLYAGIDASGALRVNHGTHIATFSQAHITNMVRKISTK